MKENDRMRATDRSLCIIFMGVKEAGYLSLELGRLLQIPDGTCALEELPLDLLGESRPPHDHRGSEAP
jgi:hypothetical protein